MRDHGALVPGLWFLEIGNVLLQAERRGRITAADVAVRLELISALPIMVDQNTVGRAWNEVLHLAGAERLTVYDATYPGTGGAARPGLVYAGQCPGGSRAAAPRGGFALAADGSDRYDSTCVDQVAGVFSPGTGRFYRRDRLVVWVHWLVRFNCRFAPHHGRSWAKLGPALDARDPSLAKVGHLNDSSSEFSNV